MPQSRVALANSLSDTLASLRTARSGLTNAWALRMSASEKAHFAAILAMSHDPADPLSTLFLKIDHLQSAYAAQSAAWAHRVKSAENARLAAVMGPCMTRHCRESSEWTARDGIVSDPDW